MCVNSLKIKHLVSSTKNYLNKKVTQYLYITKDITTNNIIKIISVQYNKLISYKIAHNCLIYLQNNNLGE